MGFPRAPIEGVVAGLAGILWAAVGLVIAAWAITAALDGARGFELAMGGLAQTGLELPWSHEEVTRFAMAKLPFLAIAAAVALLLAWSNLRKARVAFRAGNVSQDGKGELRMAAIEPRVGRPFDGTIALRDAQVPGEEFDVTLTAIGRGGVVAYRAGQKARTRPGSQGVNLPFRFEVSASAPASDASHRWRLEFAPAGRKYFGRSAIDVSLAPPSEAESRMASVAHTGPRASFAHPHSPPPPPPVAQQAHGHVEHIEKLYLKPDTVKLFKYGAIGAFVVIFVLPFVFSILGMVLAAIFAK